MIPVPAQIGKLIPRLASQHAGEVVATARAIERVLQSAGLDWHALAERIGRPHDATAFRHSHQPPPNAAAGRPTPRPPAKAQKPRRIPWDNLRRSDQTRIVEVMAALSDLTACDRGLLEKLRSALHQGQMVWLEPSEIRTLSRLRSRVGI